MLILFTAGLFAVIIGATTITKQFEWKAQTGLPHKTERLLWGPQRIKSDNNFEDIVAIYRINPAYIMKSFNLNETDLPVEFGELGYSPDEIEAFVNDVYGEAGLDPKRVYAGGSCSGH